MHSVLAARSTFSIGESILTVEDLIDKAKKADAKVVGLTDTMSITGMIDFTNRAKKADIKPILGCRLRLVDDPTWRKTKESKKAPKEYFVTWYVLSERGLKSLFRLLTLANSDARFYFTAKLSFQDLLDELKTVTAEDVMIASGDMQSVVTHPKAESILGDIARQLGHSNTFISLTPINSPYYDTMNFVGIGLAIKLGLETLVARPTLYEQGKSDARDVFSAAAENNKLTDLWVQSPVFTDLHPQSDKELLEACKGSIERLRKRACMAGPYFKQGLVNTDRLVAAVNYTWSKAPVSLPVMAEDEFKTLTLACVEGWSKRLKTSAFGHTPSKEELETVYRPRLAYELGVLKKLGFANYFLLVMDIVNYAKKNGILVGPGRGSVGGSLVAYLTGITDCDPIRFGLLFERFINPDRIDLPDADLDFMSSRRGEIIDYLIEKYGTERVAGVSNFSTLAAASAIRNISKAFGLAESDYNCSKYAPKAHGANIKLSIAAEMTPEIAKFRDTFPEVWEFCTRLEGVITNFSRHAAGVVVGGCDLVERGVIEHRKDGATMNWDKKIIEDQGLVKVDILGLEALDIIKLTLDYIRQRHGKKVNLLQIPLDDPKVLANFAEAKTTGIFQFESGGMRRLLKELGKDGVITFEDITAATALYRPGPMESGMMDSYWRRKQGIESIEYDHELMEPILKPTFGVMVYQEQVMQVSRVIAGYSAPDADKLRKIMGKKLPEEMKKERGKFVDGCVATVGATPEWAGELFDKIEGFAGYGFNKSHSVEYTLISYQAMWLKTNFMVEFFAAALSLMKEDKLPAILKDAAKMGIEIDMPDINLSSDQFEILTDTRLSIPFNRVKGIGTPSAKAIMQIRESGEITSVEDLTDRLEKAKMRRYCNVGHIDKLEKVGAFARVMPDSPSAKDPSRIRDQRDLIPGLINATVPIDRDMKTDKFTKAKLGELVSKYRADHIEDGICVKPLMGGDARFMVIYDAPNSGEEREGQMTRSEAFNSTLEALNDNELERTDGYYTALIKRPKAGKQVVPKEIELYLPYLLEEIKILQPTVIVLLGSMTARHFLPDLKGKASESAGKIVYSKELDANLVIGFNPGEIWHDPDKQLLLNDVFKSVAELVS